MDPYTPPQSRPFDEIEDRETIRELVVAWERLRVRYNLIVLPFGLGAGAIWVIHSFPLVLALMGAFGFAIVANIAYFLGPLFEVYTRGVILNGRKSRKVRMIPFWLGTGFTVLVICLYAMLPAIGLVL